MSTGGSGIPILLAAGVFALLVGVAIARAFRTGLRPAWWGGLALASGTLVLGGAFLMATRQRDPSSWWAAYGEELAFWLVFVGLVLVPVAWVAARRRPCA